MYEVSVEKTFSAAHALRDYHGATEPVHGHNWRVRVTFDGERLDSAGVLVDFVEVRRMLDQVVAHLDHKFLNDVEPFGGTNPSAENIARFVYERLESADWGAARLREVRVWETNECAAAYRPK